MMLLSRNENARKLEGGELILNNYSKKIYSSIGEIENKHIYKSSPSITIIEFSDFLDSNG